MRALFLALAATACQATPPAEPVKPFRENISVMLYQSAGSRQCERGGKTPEALKQELAKAGITVHAAMCGHDGRMYAQSCGGADGRIVIVEVPRAQQAAAANLGLKPLRELPDSTTVPCR